MAGQRIGQGGGRSCPREALRSVHLGPGTASAPRTRSSPRRAGRRRRGRCCDRLRPSGGAHASTEAPAPPQPATTPTVVPGALGGSTAAIIRPLSHSAAAGSMASWSTPRWAALAQVEEGSSSSRTTRILSALSVAGASRTSSPRRMSDADCQPPESGGRTVSEMPMLSATRAHSSVIAPRSVMRATCMHRAWTRPADEGQTGALSCGGNGEGAPPVSLSHRRRPLLWSAASVQASHGGPACR